MSLNESSKEFCCKEEKRSSKHEEGKQNIENWGFLVVCFKIGENATGLTPKITHKPKYRYNK